MGRKNFLTAVLVAALVTPPTFAQTGAVPAKKAKATKNSRLTAKTSLRTQRGPQARGVGSSDTILPAGSLAPATTPTSPYGLPLGQALPSATIPAANGLLPNASRVASTLPVTAQCTPGTPGCVAALPPAPAQQSQSNMAPMMAALAALAGAFGGNKNKTDSNNKNNSNNNNSSDGGGGGGGGSPADTNGGNYSPNTEPNPPATGGSAEDKSDKSAESGSSRQIKDHVLAADDKPGEEKNKTTDHPPQAEPSTCERPPAGSIPDWQKVSGRQTAMAEPQKKHCAVNVMTKIASLTFLGHTISHSTPIEAKPYVIQTVGSASPIFSPAAGTITDVREVDLGGIKDDCDSSAHPPAANPGGPKTVQCVVTIHHDHCPGNDKISCVSQFRFAALNGHAQGKKNSCMQFKQGDHVKSCQVIAKIGSGYEASKAFYSLTGSDNSDQTPQLSDRSPAEKPAEIGFKPGDFNKVGFK